MLDTSMWTLDADHRQALVTPDPELSSALKQDRSALHEEVA